MNGFTKCFQNNYLSGHFQAFNKMILDKTKGENETEQQYVNYQKAYFDAETNGESRPSLNTFFETRGLDDLQESCESSESSESSLPHDSGDICKYKAQWDKEKYHFGSKTKRFDYQKPLILLDVLINDENIIKEKYGKRVIAYLSQRINIGDWLNVLCVGKVVVQPGLDFLRSGWNRSVEFMLLIGKWYRQQTEMLYCLGYLITTLNGRKLRVAIAKRKHLYSLQDRTDCARGVKNSGGNIEYCHEKPHDMCCAKHEAKFDQPYLQKDVNIQSIVPLLLSRITKEESKILDLLYVNIVKQPCIQNMNVKLCHYLLNKYYYPLFNFLDSNLFTQWEYDELSEELARIIVILNSFILIHNHRQKFMERMINATEPALCIPSVLLTLYRIDFAKNLVIIGRSTLAKFTARHLELQDEKELFEILQTDAASGYVYGCAYLLDEKWNLIENLSTETDPNVFDSEQYKVLKIWCVENVAADMTNLPTEKSIKPVKKACGHKRIVLKHYKPYITTN